MTFDSGSRARVTHTKAPAAFIDQGSECEGKLSFKDTVRIDGHFSGEIASENTLIVGESGEVEASIKSRVVIISGTVDGPIEAKNRLVLHKTAIVNGDVETGSLVVENGAVLNGRINRGCFSSPVLDEFPGVTPGAAA